CWISRADETRHWAGWEGRSGHWYLVFQPGPSSSAGAAECASSARILRLLSTDNPSMSWWIEIQSNQPLAGPHWKSGHRRPMDRSADSTLPQNLRYGRQDLRGTQAAPAAAAGSNACRQLAVRGRVDV